MYEEYKNELITVRFDSYWFGQFTGIQNDNIKENVAEWLKKHPRSKRPPMDWLGKTRNGMLPSWNRFINCPSRIIQDTWKKDLNEYTRYCIKGQHVPRAYLNKCVVIAVQFKPTKTASDNDNTYVKASLDAMVKEEVLQEDNYKVVKYFGSYSVVDKDDPRTEIRIYPIYDGFDFNYVMDVAMNDVKELEEKYN